jgi:hypothetical protein
MKLADVAAELVIDPRKLRDYALNPESPYGRHKARVFQQTLGFTRENYSALLVQIEQQALQAEAVARQEDEFGVRYRVDLRVRGPNGDEAIVRTGWVIPHESKQARLTTLYVLR